MSRAAAALVASSSLLLAVPIVVALAAAASTAAPTAAALDEIPPPYLALYQEAAAARCPTLPWAILAAIGNIESDHGRTGGASLQLDGAVTPPIIGVALDGSPGVARILDTDRGRFDHDPVYDRAVGPMQFLSATWNLHGLDASRDGVADPHNAVDAIHTAARYLCANGAHDAARVPDAVWAYNHSWDYVDRVLDLAARYSEPAMGMVPGDPTLIAAVLANPRLDIYPAGREDIAAGRIDLRTLTVLQLASERWALTISSLKTGHSRCIGGGDYRGCRVSHHWYGRAADISAVDGRAVNRNNGAARELALWLAMIPRTLVPSEVGTPWPDLSGHGGFFSDFAHQDHVHLGYETKP